MRVLVQSLTKRLVKEVIGSQEKGIDETSFFEVTDEWSL